MATLYKVTYHKDEASPEETYLTKYFASGFDPGSYIVDGDNWPNNHVTFARWEPVAEDVAGPQVIGSIYNMPLHESGWSAGEREAARRGIR